MVRIAIQHQLCNAIVRLAFHVSLSAGATTLRSLPLVLLAAVCLAAQTTGDLGGQVLDISGRVVDGASIEINNEQKGWTRRVLVDSGGYYRFPLVPIGFYTVTARAAGFGVQVRSGIQIEISESIRMNFLLSPGIMHQRLDVSGKALADSEQNGRGSTINSALLLNLPINGRDYARFSLLTPGAVARGNEIADLSFNGLQTVHNQFAIDGIDASRIDQPLMANGNERGPRLLTGSLDSIGEFRVSSANYRAEYGRAASAWVSIATKSGTNTAHGSMFHYLRNSALDARNLFNVESDPQARFGYNNFGSNASGALRPNVTFFFANYEGSRQRIGATASGTVPSADLRRQLIEMSPVLGTVLRMYPEGTSVTGDPFIASYTTVRTLSVREDTGSARFDHRLGVANAIFVRFNVNDSSVLGPLFTVNPGAFGLLDRQFSPVRTTNVAGMYEHTIGTRAIHALSAGLQKWRSLIDSDGVAEPLIIVTGLTIQPGARGWGRTDNESRQLGSLFTVGTGRHILKWGVNVWRTQLDRESGPASILSFSSVSDFVANRVAAATFAAGGPGSAVRSWQTGAFAQDTWQSSDRLTFDFGLRHDYSSVPLDPSGRMRPYYIASGSLAPPGARIFRANWRNLSPRLGVAWLMGSRLALRCGYGVFFQSYPPGTAAGVSANTRPANTAILRQEVPDLAYPVQPFPGSGGQAIPNAFGFEWNKPDTYAQHWNLTVSAQNPSDRIEAGYVANHAVHLRRPININLFDSLLGRRPNQAFANINIETATGNSNYHSLQLSWNHRFHTGFGSTLNYTFGHAIDDVPDQGLFPATPQDTNNLRAERGNSSQDVRHSFNASFLYPIRIARTQDSVSSKRGLLSSLISGWQWSGLVLARSGMATTITLGSNTSGNGNLVNQRPDAVPSINPYASPRSTGKWLNANAFRIPARGRFGNLGRNTVFGPRLIQIDSALFKNLRLSKSMTFQLRVEFFNLLNHPNLAQPSTVLTDSSFGRIFNTLGRTLGIGGARQIQIAGRISF